jgi:chromosome partitioning protein
MQGWCAISGVSAFSLTAPPTDWLVVRNRLSMMASPHKHMVATRLNELSFRLGFRSVDGFAEREVYREFFPRGLTALDNLDAAGIGTNPSLDQVAVRKELASLVLRLNLPLDERGRRRAANRAEWLKQADKPLEIDDIIGMPAIGLQNESARRKEAAQ